MFRDAYDQMHERADQNARIVSLVPSVTELVVELDLGAQLVGRTGFCIHPAQTVRQVPKLGGTKDVNLDALYALKPSHVIVNIDENTKPVYEQLKQRVPNVIVTHPSAPEDNLALYRLLGGIFSRDNQAERLVTRFEQALSRVRLEAASLPPKRVLYLIWRDPWMSVAADTYIARMLALVNWQVIDAESSERYPQVSNEHIARSSIDLALLSSEPYPFRNKHLDEVAAICPPQCSTQLVDGEMMSWYGSRAIAGLDYLRRLAQNICGLAA